MFDLNIEVQNVKDLQRALRATPEILNTVIEDAATTIRNLVIGRTPVGITKTAGQTKASWSEVERTSTGFTFGTDKDHAEILEEGKYKRVGPRTIAIDGGIYSRQAPGGMIGPILENTDIMDKVINRVAEELVRSIARAAT